jgi:drug/metabolite transporter (DMT)-like permease
MKQNLILGVVCALVSTVFYSILTALNKAYAVSLPLPMMVFMQSAVSLVLFLPLVWKNGAKNIFYTTRLPLHVTRAVLSMSISYFLFSAVKFIPLTNAMLLAMTTPLIIPFVAFFLLKQKINHRLWTPMLMGFAGIALVLHPDGRIFNPAAFLALGAALATSCTMLAVRRLSLTDSTETIMFYFFLLSTIVSGFIAVPFWVSLSPHMWSILLLGGVMYFFAQYIMTIALRYANAQLISTLLYMNVVNSAVISAIFWHTVPTGLMMAGILLTVSGGILCIRAEHRHNKQMVAWEKEGLVYVKEA